MTKNRLFARVVSMVFALTVASLGGLVLAPFLPEGKAQDRLTDACDTVLKVTVGGLVGVLGGRAAAPDRVKEP